MAVIREEMVLADRFSATFNRLISFYQRSTAAASAAEAAHRRFQAASGRLGTALNHLADAATEASSALTASASGTEELAGSTIRASSAQDRMNRSMSQGSSAASGLAKRVMSLAKAYAGMRTVQAFVGLTDSFTETSARLDLVKDKFKSTVNLQEMLYQSAQRTGTSYLATADAVSKMALNAGSAFNSLEEVTAFMEQVNKQFLIAGASAQDQKYAMIQLTQAMSSGALRGEELNSILDNAPGIARAIEKYMGYAEGSIKKYAEAGDITAQVVKNALFYMAEETDAAAGNIPLTFGRAWEKAGSAAVMAMQPAMQKLNDLLNSELGRAALNGLISGIEMLGGAASWVIDLLAQGAQWVADNWETVSAVLMGLAVGLAAVMVGSALVSAAAWMLANLPLVIMIGTIIALILKMREMGASWEEIGEKIGSIAGWLYAFVYNLVVDIWNFFAMFADFLENLFNDPLAAIARLFVDTFSAILGIIETVAGALDALTGWNVSGLVAGFKQGLDAWADKALPMAHKTSRMEKIDYNDTMYQWSQMGGGIGKALDNFNPGDVFGKFSEGGFDYSSMMGGISNTLGGIKEDTGAIKRSVALSEEDVKLLVDMAERRYVNNINLTAQTPVVTINGQNTGDTAEDLQWLENALKRILVEQAASHTDLSYP